MYTLLTIAVLLVLYANYIFYTNGMIEYLEESPPDKGLPVFVGVVLLHLTALIAVIAAAIKYLP